MIILSFIGLTAEFYKMIVLSFVGLTAEFL